MNSIKNDSSKEQTEIDLVDVFKVLWKAKLILLGLIVISGVLSASYALSLPNLYKSKAMLSLSGSGGKGGLGALASQYSGLAEAAGFSLPSGDSGRMEQAAELVISWPFLSQIISKYKLEASLVAATGWRAREDALIYDASLYDQDTGWVVNDGKSERPTSWKSYSQFREFLTVSIDAKTGFMVLSVEHFSPTKAKAMVEIITTELNQYFQQSDIKDSRSNIEYLEKKIEETKITEMKEVFFNMIESQMKTLMLAEVSDEYFLKTLIPPMVAEEKSAPNRSLMVLLGVIIAFIFGSIIIVIKFILGRQHV